MPLCQFSINANILILIHSDVQIMHIYTFQKTAFVTLYISAYDSVLWLLDSTVVFQVNRFFSSIIRKEN